MAKVFTFVTTEKIVTANKIEETIMLCEDTKENRSVILGVLSDLGNRIARQNASIISKVEEIGNDVFTQDQLRTIRIIEDPVLSVNDDRITFATPGSLDKKCQCTSIVYSEDSSTIRKDEIRFTKRKPKFVPAQRLATSLFNLHHEAHAEFVMEIMDLIKKELIKNESFSDFQKRMK